MTVNINGTDHEVNVDENMPILWVLRDVLELTGTKFGCGIGVCGSCNILMDGNPVRSCITPISAVTGKKIITVEGVEKENPYLTQAWKDLNVPQCGYCQPGQLISALSLLKKNAQPTDLDIDQQMSGNICRCGTYVRIRSAIHLASESSRNAGIARTDDNKEIDLAPEGP